MKPLDVQDSTFEQEVLARSRQVPVVVDFWAPWCGPCRALGPVLERLAQEFSGDFVLAKVNTDENPVTAMRYRIQGIPAVKVFRDGQVAGEFVGALPEPEVRRFLARFVPSRADKLAREARTIETQDPGRAETLYREALDADRGHPAALLGLARIALARGDAETARGLVAGLDTRGVAAWEAEAAEVRLRLDGKARDAIPELQARLEADPGDLDARYDLAMALVSAGRLEDALAHLLTIVQKDRSFRDDGARKAMIDIFQTLGPDHPVAGQWRERLAMALYR